MDGRSGTKAVRLSEKDYSMFRDIYEFYYIDFDSAGKRYYPHQRDDIARVSFNQRMRALRQAEFVAAVSFSSDRRVGAVGHLNYAYTLTKKGLRALGDYWDQELDWDTGRKDRRDLFIIHHLNVYRYACLYREQIESGQLMDYVGEFSGKYQIPGINTLLNQDKEKEILRDFVKPDATLFWKSGDWIIPWLVEYERDSRQSKKLVTGKLQNHAEYATKGYYQLHGIMKEMDANVPPIFLLYCENPAVINFRTARIMENNISFYSSQDGKGFGDVLFAVQDQVEANPYGAVYYRLSNEAVTYDQVNFVQGLAGALRKNRVQSAPDTIEKVWIPAFRASRTRDGIKLDGILNLVQKGFQASYLIRYYPRDTGYGAIAGELQAIEKALKEGTLTGHPYLAKSYEIGNIPILLLIVDTPEQESELLKIIATHDFGEQLGNVYVSSRELVGADPFGAHWMTLDEEDRVTPD